MTDSEKLEAERMAQRSAQNDIRIAELLAAQWAAQMDAEAQFKGWTK